MCVLLATLKLLSLVGSLACFQMPPASVRMHRPSFYLKKGGLQLDEIALIGRVSFSLSR